MKAFKATKSDMTCLDFQYKLNKVFKLDGRIIPCLYGFHSCWKLGDVIDYYHRPEIRFFEVEIPNDPIVHGDKFVSNKIEFIREIEKGEYEPVFSKSPGHSYLYAGGVLKGRFELGEEAISKSAHYSYYYAVEVLKGRFELGEEAISKSSSYSFYYAKNVLKGRFELGEEAISKNAYNTLVYDEFLKLLLCR